LVIYAEVIVEESRPEKDCTPLDGDRMQKLELV